MVKWDKVIFRTCMLLGLFLAWTAICLIYVPINGEGKGKGPTASELKIDTSLVNANASFIGEASNNYAGYAVAKAGDVNGDEFDDFLVGAYGNSQEGLISRGQVYLILGNATIGNGCAKDMNLGAASASFIGEAANDRAGYSIASAGDVNGDGFDDILVGAYGNSQGGLASRGQAYLILGNATIGTGCAKNMNLGAANASFIGEASQDYAGSAVAGAGDVNGDGFDDFLVGANQNSQGGSNAGQAYLILGNATIGNGCAKDMNLGAASASFIGEAANDRAGYSIAGAGDMNGDNLDDILVGAYQNAESANGAGQTYLILGNTTIGNGCAKDMSLSAANASFLGEGLADLSSMSLAGTGDVNGDGFDDIIIGAPQNREGAIYAGQAYLILGNATIGNGCAKDMNLGAANASFNGEAESDYAGRSVASAGDVNCDGFDDILVGAYQNDEGTSDGGQVYLILGNDSIGNGCAKDMRLSAANASFLSQTSFDYTGFSVAGVGDVNGDKSGDFLIGAYYNNEGGSGAGQAYLINGWDSAAPIITGVGIAPSTWFNATPPVFLLSYVEYNPNCSWYSFNGGVTNSCVAGTTGSLIGWEVLGTQGSVTVSFWMNDTAGHPSVRFDLIINRDTVAPIITETGIVPGTLLNATPPSFTLSFTELHPHHCWYSLDGGTTNTTIETTTGVLAGWETLDTQGVVTVSFWINDTAGNPSAPYNLLLYRDSIGPAVVTDLQVGFPALDGFVLSWIAPGDNNSLGTVSGYLVKYSLNPILENNFNDATTYVQNWDSFASGGVRESRSITGLKSNMTYYFALKAFDKTGNNCISISNIGIGKTAMDTQVPALTGPADISFENGAVGNNIVWIIADGTTLLPTYRIIRDGFEVVPASAWPVGGIVSYSVDGLPVGQYSYTIIVTDGHGNFAVNEVTITVREINPLDWALISTFIAGIALASVILVALQNRRLQRSIKVLEKRREVSQNLQPMNSTRSEKLSK